MTDNQDKTASESWWQPMKPRNPGEVHRQASFLELFFDLCFVVAIAQAATELHHALAEDHIYSGVLSFLTVFFAIWWAWMNFTWFASAYDNDDVPYRIAALVQIVGALILAAGVQRGFEQQNFDVIFLGYAVMRAGLVALWIRAALNDPARKTAAMRYAVGLTAVMFGWAVMLITNYWPLWGWWLMAFIELAVPVWAEYTAKTPWHPHHIAERYGLFTIIVLGESVLAATNAVQVALNQQAATFDALLTIIAGGLLIMFSLWWLYFAKPAHKFLTSNRVAFVWGYGHYFIFLSAAAVGAGLAVNVDHVTGHTELSDPVVAATVTVPAALFLCVLWALHIRPHRKDWWHTLLFPISTAGILAATFSPVPILISGLITAVMVSIGIGLMQSG